MSTVVRLEIARPRRAVFQLIADPRNDFYWNALVTDVQLLTPEPIAVGSRYISVLRGAPYAGEVTVLDRWQQVSYELNGQQARLVADVYLRDCKTGTGTQVDWCATLELYGLIRLLRPVVMTAFPRDMRHQLSAFKRLCESYTH